MSAIVPPRAIRAFSRAWWASTALWLAGVRLAWERTQGQIAATPAAAPVAGWAQWATTAAVLIVTVALWYTVARRGSVVAKWVLVAVTGLGALRSLGLLASLAVVQYPHPWSTACSVAASVLAVVAAAMLFRHDARPWFGEAEEDL